MRRPRVHHKRVDEVRQRSDYSAQRSQKYNLIYDSEQNTWQAGIPVSLSVLFRHINYVTGCREMIKLNLGPIARINTDLTELLPELQTQD